MVTITAGDQSAMARFYRRTLSFVLAKAHTILSSREDAEEIANDVYAFIWRNPTAYDPERGTVLAWLSIITRHRAIDRLRLRHPTVSLDDVGQADLLASLVGPEPSSDHLLSQVQWANAAQDALSLLTPLRRHLLDLAFFQELSHHEIAGTVGLPLGSVKSHLRRSLHSLRSVSLAHT